MSILQRTLIFIGLMIAGAILYSIWFGGKADKFDARVVPYLDKNLSVLVGWQYDQLLPLLSPPARVEFDTDDGRGFYKLLSNLGPLKTSGRPEYRSSDNASIDSMGEVTLVSYEVGLDFIAGPGMLKIQLLLGDEGVFVHHFGIQSEVFNTLNDNSE